MRFALDDDQQALRDSARRFLELREARATSRRAYENGSQDVEVDALYRAVAELGWLSVTVPESWGGLGLSVVHQMVIAEEIGRANAPGPWLANAGLVIPALCALGARELLGPLMDGTLRAAFVSDPDFVLDGDLAQGFVVLDDGRACWYDADDMSVSPHETVDGSRRSASVRVVGSGRDLGEADAVASVLDAATALVCGEMVGGMQWMLDTTVDYARQREQFGRPIGSFQAVKHRLADMLLRTESARSATYYAAWACATAQLDAAYATSVAKAYCSEAAPFVAAGALQLHAGIGFTWEHDLHLYFKRALMNAVLLGDAAYHGERVLRLDPERLDEAPAAPTR